MDLTPSAHHVPAHAALGDDGTWRAAPDEDGWAALEYKSLAAPQATFHARARRLANIFIAAARTLQPLIDDPVAAAAALELMRELCTALDAMAQEAYAFEAAHAEEAPRVANHWELAYRAAYRTTLLCIDRFCDVAGVPPAEMYQAMEAEEPHVGDDFPKFRHDMQPLDLLERPAVERYGIPGPPRGYLHQAGDFFRSHWKNFFPPLLWVPQYQLIWLLWDAIAGITIGIFVVAQGMAYAVLAGLPPQVGLYSATVPVWVYCLFGTSRELSLGPFALVAILVEAALSKVDIPTGSTEAQTTAILVQSSADLMLYCGLFLTVFGLLRLGFISNFISVSFLSGFTSAAGIIIQTSQLATLFGERNVERKGSWIETLIEFCKNLPSTHWPTMLTGFVTIGVLIGIKQFNQRVKCRGRKIFPVPGMMVVCIVGMIVSYLADFPSLGIVSIGTIPSGFNVISVPSFSLFSLLWVDALIIALVVYLTSATIALRYANKKEYHIDSSQEQLAIGLSNVVGSFFSGFVVGGALARSAVAESAGARSQVYSAVSALTVTIVLLVATGALFWMPVCILSGAIIVAAYGLWDFSCLPALWRVRKSDFVVWWVSFLATLFLGTSTGLLLALAFSIVLVVYLISRPHIATLGRLPRTTAWRDASRFPTALVTDGVVVLRIDSDMFFANISFIHESIVNAVENDPSPIAVRVLILDFSSVSDIDYTAVTEMRKTFAWLEEHEVRVLATAVSGPVRDVMRRSEFLDLIGAENVYWLHQDAARVARAHLRSTSVEMPTDEAALRPAARLSSTSVFGGRTQALSFAEQPKAHPSFLQRMV